MPAPPSASPRQSSLLPRWAATPPGAVTGTNFQASQSEARQNGTTMKKIERQPNRSTSTPPMLGPIAGASTTPMPKMPLARPCSSRLEGAQDDDRGNRLHDARGQALGHARRPAPA